MESITGASSGLLAREFAVYRDEIAQLMRCKDWERLVSSLSQLNTVAEGAGYRDICLKSQAVMDLLGRRGAGRDLPGDRVLGLMDGLLGDLAHSEWREKELLSSLPVSEGAPLSAWENPRAHDSRLQ
ncbi:MAG: hypothetical protein KGQ59_10515 [Bdellovibrionales bacterium]|nr:hypothetical protein [Bdellovibrionales bacterium]